MLEILYCFDENYNTQGFSSIYSLLNQTSSKVNINIIHKTFEDERFIPNEILNHANLNSMQFLLHHSVLHQTWLWQKIFHHD